MLCKWEWIIEIILFHDIIVIIIVLLITVPLGHTILMIIEFYLYFLEFFFFFFMNYNFKVEIMYTKFLIKIDYLCIFINI